jgi:hypothetical protein
VLPRPFPTPLPQALALQRSRGTDLAALQAFGYSSLQGELQVGGVFIRVFNQRGRSGANASNATVTAATATAAAASGAAPSGPLSAQQQRGGGPTAPAGAAAGQAGSSSAGAEVQPADPSGFCKALVRHLYDALVERCFRGAELQQLSPREAADVTDVLTALSGGVEGGGLAGAHTNFVWVLAVVWQCHTRL